MNDLLSDPVRSSFAVPVVGVMAAGGFVPRLDLLYRMVTGFNCAFRSDRRLVSLRGGRLRSFRFDRRLV